MDLVGDRAKLDAYRRGDAVVLTEIYRALAPEVGRFLQRGFSFSSGGTLCRFEGYRSTFDVEDLTHEVFARIFSEKARAAYDGLTPFKAYLLGIAKNAVIDEFRSKRRVHVPFVEGAPDEPAAEPQENASDPVAGTSSITGSPEKDVIDGELAALVRTFRSELSPEEEEIFRLRFDEQRSLAEVQEKTGRSPSKVKTTEKKLRARLFERIWRSGYLDGHRESEDSGGWIARLKRSFVFREEEP